MRSWGGNSTAPGTQFFCDIAWRLERRAESLHSDVVMFEGIWSMRANSLVQARNSNSWILHLLIQSPRWINYMPIRWSTSQVWHIWTSVRRYVSRYRPIPCALSKQRGSLELVEARRHRKQITRSTGRNCDEGRQAADGEGTRQSTSPSRKLQPEWLPVGWRWCRQLRPLCPHTGAPLAVQRLQNMGGRYLRPPVHETRHSAPLLDSYIHTDHYRLWRKQAKAPSLGLTFEWKEKRTNCGWWNVVWIATVIFQHLIHTILVSHDISVTKLWDEKPSD